MTVIEHDYDDLLTAIGNLSGHRCAGQTSFLAHVEAVRKMAAALADQNADAMDALRFYADPATWDTLNPRGIVTMNTIARQDNGERARAALRGQ